MLLDPSGKNSATIVAEVWFLRTYLCESPVDLEYTFLLLCLSDPSRVDSSFSAVSFSWSSKFLAKLTSDDIPSKASFNPYSTLHRIGRISVIFLCFQPDFSSLSPCYRPFARAQIGRWLNFRTEPDINVIDISTICSYRQLMFLSRREWKCPNLD